jgi:hypothetical protein
MATGGQPVNQPTMSQQKEATDRQEDPEVIHQQEGLIADLMSRPPTVHHEATVPSLALCESAHVMAPVFIGDTAFTLQTFSGAPNGEDQADK